jgi:uncharacterized membrane protein YhaH (DUF805 family)
MNYIKKIYSGRIGRKNYILGILFSVLALFLLLFLVSALSLLFASLLSLHIYTYLNLFFIAVGGIIFWIYYLSIHVRRLHDIGRNGWWSLLYVLFPFHLWLMFCRGQENKNQYGDVPAKSAKLSDTISDKNSPANTFLKGDWFKVSLLIIIIAIIGGAFYWYSYRPAQIIKMCQKEQCNIPVVCSGVFADLGGSCTEKCSVSEKEIKYNDCLRENGL